MTVHPTAIVEDGALLGAGVELTAQASAAGHPSVGARTVLHRGAVLGGEAQIRGDDAPSAKLTVGEDCVIREHVTMNLGSARGGGLTSVGRNGYFMAYSHVGHDCHVGDGVTFANGAQLGGHVEIGDGVIMGGLSAVQQFGRVGRGAMIGGVTGVNTDVIPYGIAAGDHAELGGLNRMGLKRRGLPRASINALRAAFKLIFLENDGSMAERARAAKAKWAEVAEV